jgi:hypothetical protein
LNARTDNLAPATLAETPQAQLPAIRMSNSSLVLDGHNMNQMSNLARIMASGRSTVPQHLRGSEGDCMAIVMQSMQWGMNPYSVAQKTHLVQGTLGYEAQLVAAVINNSGVVQDRFHFEWFGPWEKIVGKFKTVESKTKKDDDGNFKKYIVPDWNQADEQGLGVKVWATMKGESAPRELILLMSQARTRNSTLWTEDPKQQIAYLAQKRWARLYAPDVILGVYTMDELEVGAPVNMGPAQVVTDSDWDGVPPDLKSAAEAAADKGLAEYQKFWQAAGKDGRKTLAKAHDNVLKDRAQKADAARTVESSSAPQATPSATAKTEPPAKTFDEVMAMLCAAKNEDALMVAADWIGVITDADERALLNGKFDELLTTMKGPQS